VPLSVSEPSREAQQVALEASRIETIIERAARLCQEAILAHMLYHQHVDHSACLRRKKPPPPG
jgi:hypothetical protein